MTATATVKGLTLDVFHHPRYRTCTNGATRYVDQITVIGWIDRTGHRSGRVVHLLDRDSQIFEPRVDAPAYALVVRNPTGDRILSLEPVVYDKAIDQWRVRHSWTVAGGNYAGVTDSRFSELCRRLVQGPFYGAIAVHDRFEG